MSRVFAAAKRTALAPPAASTVRLPKPAVQPKLKIGAPDDRYEREADRMADQVMRMPDPVVQRRCIDCDEEIRRKPTPSELPRGGEPNTRYEKPADQVMRMPETAVQRRCKDCDEELQRMPAKATPAVQRVCTECEEKLQQKPRETGAEAMQVQRACAECESEEALQRSVQPGVEGLASGHGRLVEAARGGGRPLPSSERAYFEPRFGVDFGSVRIRDDARADAAARSVGARAYTLGKDVVFRSGEYSPGGTTSRHLLAHELTHTIQQGRLTDSGDRAVLRRQEEEQQEGPADPPSLPLTEIPDAREPRCPRTPTRLGDLAPVPPCNTGAPEIDGDLFQFCLDSDVLIGQQDRDNLRRLGQTASVGSTFEIHGYSSFEGREDYNLRLSCHRAKRAAREVINAGVPETSLIVIAQGRTRRFGATRATRGLNRAALVRVGRPELPSTAIASDATARQIAERAKQRILNGGYTHGADGYVTRWTCGRFRSLADAAQRTRVLVEGEPGASGRPSHSDPLQPDVSQGSTNAFGPNTITLPRDILQATDPVDCAASRIADLTFHHVARPAIPNFSQLHASGTHMLFLGGFGGCAVRASTLLGGQQIVRVSQPLPTDPNQGRQPACAPTLPGATQPQRQPRGGLRPEPLFVAGALELLSPGSGPLGSLREQRLTVFMQPSLPFVVRGQVDASGDPAEIANYDLGFVQTIASENDRAFYVGGGSVNKEFPLPLRDGPGPGEAGGPPWYGPEATSVATPGLQSRTLQDAPDVRAFKVLPNLDRTRFFLNLPNPSREFPIVGRGRRSSLRPGFATDSPNDVADRARRRLIFQTWMVARRRTPPAPLTLMDTQFLAGVRLTLEMNADFISRAGGFEGSGTYTVSTQRATPGDTSQVQLRGATPADFVSADGTPLFAEYLRVSQPPARSATRGLDALAFLARVRSLAEPHRRSLGLLGEMRAEVRVNLDTGRLPLDNNTLSRPAPRRGSPAGPPPTIRISGDGSARDRRRLAVLLFPEVRKLTLGRFPYGSANGIVPLPVTLGSLSP